jgi:DNA replication protein DnaC
MNIKEKIISLTKRLKMPGIRKHYEEQAKIANETEMSYEIYLKELLEKEVELRDDSMKYRRIRMANFPQKHYFEDLEVEQLPKDAQKKLKEMKTLEFIEKGQNIIFVGNPGTGKTFLSTALGIEACMQGYKVMYVTIPTLITQLKESKSERTLRAYQSRFENYDLVICDELSFITFDKEGSELLFTTLSLRSLNKSTIITSNLSFERWEELFGDPVLTAAMVDRLSHKALFVNMEGDSYRAKETQKMIKASKYS